MERHQYRAVMIVRANKRDEVDAAWRANVDPDGLSLTVGLSKDGKPPHSHYWCGISLTLTQLTRMLSVADWRKTGADIVLANKSGSYDKRLLDAVGEAPGLSVVERVKRQELLKSLNVKPQARSSHASE
jgi:hypothetical protein